MRVLDLFCGGGGSSWGAHKAGARIVCGVDAWDVAIKTYQDNFPKAKAVRERLTAKFDPAQLGDLGRIDMILASPECTSHTCARGKRKRCDDSQNTAFLVLKFIDYFNPRWVVIENVVHMKQWKRYNELIAEIRKRRFNIREQTHDAALFGVPQNRRRLFIICDQYAEVPEIIPITGTVKLTAESILDPCRTWKRGPLDNGRRALSTLERAKRAIDVLGRGKPFLIVYYGSDAAGGWQPLDRPIRTLTTLDRFGLVEWDNNTPTLRMLQVPELRRAMGFSDDFQMLQGSRRDKIKVLGNGVCPPVMTLIIENIMKNSFFGKKYQPIAINYTTKRKRIASVNMSRN
ncbi:MAG: DNA cytosine methyltransferase [Magnetococcales bacterium]|nr:DNA cytosine methyltransferase [Magnetococcales bacterium]MBF0420735.1 DNA cytosine methyltransferase [Magnetococcales bacterium]